MAGTNEKLRHLELAHGQVTSLIPLFFDQQRNISECAVQFSDGFTGTVWCSPAKMEAIRYNMAQRKHNLDQKPGTQQQIKNGPNNQQDMMDVIAQQRNKRLAKKAESRPQFVSLAQYAKKHPQERNRLLNGTVFSGQVLSTLDAKSVPASMASRTISPRRP